MLFIVSLSFIECSAGSGVNSIVCDFEGFRIKTILFGSAEYVLQVWVHLLFGMCLSSCG